MSRNEFLLALLILGAIGGCTNNWSKTPPREVSTKVGYSMTPGDANSVRKRIDGERVVLYGFLRYRDEDFGIWTSEQDFDRNEISQCVTPLATGDIGSRLQELDGQQVRIIGTFEKLFGDDDLIMAGPCNFTGIRVSEILSEE